MNRVSILVLPIAFAVSIGTAAAQGAGGGADTPSTNSAVASCVQKGPDGKPVNKLSSEEICPMYQFQREDCARDGKLGLVNEGTLEHCSKDAMGLTPDGSTNVPTGSVVRTTPAAR